MEKSIELDCAPGGIRPGELLPMVLEGTEIPVKDPVSKCFGNWTWNYSEIPDEIWKKHNTTIATRIKGLYDSGVIRYGSW